MSAMTTATLPRPHGREVPTDHPGARAPRRGGATPGAVAAARRAGPHTARGRAATRRPPRRVHRRRAALALLAVVVVLLALARPALEREQATPAATAAVVVAEGQTVWDLALPHAPAGTDPAVYVAEVVAANGLDPRAVPPGTVVRLP